MIEITVLGERIDLEGSIDLAIPMKFGGKQPVYFGAPSAKSIPHRSGSFIGDRNQGGSCNVSELTIVAHCNGTHTECVGHVSRDYFSIGTLEPVCFAPSTLISVDGSKPITKQTLVDGLEHVNKDWLEGLVVRTTPNTTNKLVRDYDANPSTYLEHDAIAFISQLGVNHLVLDIPSVDHPESTDLPSHHTFWGHTRSEDDSTFEFANRTITELAYIPTDIPDGRYALSISWPRLQTDAAPSRPLLFPVREK